MCGQGVASSSCDKRRALKDLVVALNRVRLSLTYNKGKEGIKDSPSLSGDGRR